MTQFLVTNREGTEVDRMHEVTSPVFRPFPPATSQIGRLLGQIHVLQSMTNIVIFIQPFSKQTKVFESSPSVKLTNSARAVMVFAGYRVQRVHHHQPNFTFSFSASCGLI